MLVPFNCTVGVGEALQASGLEDAGSRHDFMAADEARMAALSEVETAPDWN